MTKNHHTHIFRPDWANCQAKYVCASRVSFYKAFSLNKKITLKITLFEYVSKEKKLKNFYALYT